MAVFCRVVVTWSNAKHYKAEGTITEYFEFEGRDHWTCGADGWEATPTMRSHGRSRVRPGPCRAFGAVRATRHPRAVA